MADRSARWSAVLLTGWLAVIAVATLSPAGTTTRSLSLCMACGEFGGSGFLLNVLLFVPLGGLLARSGAQRWQSALIGLGLSAAIETAQYLVVPGRITSLGDLCANACGAVLGAALWSHRASFAERVRERDGVLISSYALGVAFMLGFGHWSSQPWLPSGEWFLQRTPIRPWSDPHSGTLQVAAVNRRELPSDRIRDRAVVRQLQNGSAVLDLIEAVGPPPRRLAYTVRLVHAKERRELFAMARNGNALILHRLTNAARLHLSAPGVRIPGAYADLIDRSATWGVQLVNGTVVLNAASEARTYHAAAPSMLRAWAALLPRALDVTPWQLRALDTIWAIGLLTPLFLFAGAARRQQHARPHIP